MKASFISYKSFLATSLIPVIHNITGQFFTCVTASRGGVAFQAFGLILDDQEQLIWTEGMSLRLPSDKFFHRLTFIPLAGSVPLSIAYYAGTHEGKAGSLTINVGRSANKPISGNPLPGRATIVPGPVAINALETLPLSGLSLGRRRKQIFIVNRDPVQELILQDNAGNQAGIIFPGSSLCLETTANAQLYNPGGAPVSIAVGPAFYA